MPGEEHTQNSPIDKPPSPTTQQSQQQQPFPSTSSQESSSSYVYPVRSLLTGIVHDQPHPQRPAPPKRQSTLDRLVGEALSQQGNQSATGADDSGTKPAEHSDSGADAQGSTVRRRQSLDLGRGLSTTSVQRSNSSKAEMSSSSTTTAIPKKKTKKSSHSARHSREIAPPSPNFRHFPAGDDASSSRTFTSNNPPAHSSASSAVSGPMGSQTFVSGPTGEPVPITSQMTYEPMEDLEYKHLSQISEISGDSFASAPRPPSPPPPPPPSLPFNPSEYGLVHLPPTRSRPSSDGGSVVSSGQRSRDSGSRYVTAPSSQNRSTSTDPINALAQPLSFNSEYERTSSNSGSGSQGYSTGGSRSNSDSVAESRGSEPLVTMRYQHIEDENGNHLVVGREGLLTQCEDEPIRTPGAVQSFGVLIAVDEDVDNGNLSVRQVSENSTELLGLSPKFLFSLECFTQTLPDSQADILWDNIQYLQEPDPDMDDGPHVFTLTGWGGKDTAKPGEPSLDGQRIWTCWCAVHRPILASGTDSPLNSSVSSMLILEFELEKDTLNPLYPISNDAPSLPSSPTRMSSGSSAKGSSSTSSSDHTLVAVDDLTPPATMDAAGETPVIERPVERPEGQTQVSEETVRPPLLQSLSGLDGEDEWNPSAEDILESTTSRSKPIPALERLRKISRQTLNPTSSTPTSGLGVRARRHAARTGRVGGGPNSVGMMDVFAVMAQINEQLGAAPDLESFLKVVAGVVKDLSQFHRVMVYQFDDVWNGQVVAELVDWSHSHDLFQGLHFPASDIPAQARQLYATNKVRLLYDRSQTTARIVVRSKADLEIPLDMTHCYLRAMSPIHIKYLANMGVRASMSISIMAFGALWGLITCHSYGTHRMRVSFPVRQMLRLLSQSISRNIERLSYAQRLHTRRLINTMASDNHPTGHIVSNADDLLGLFDADYGILVIGEGAKILGPNLHGQEILVMAEFLRLKEYETIKVSQAVTKDFPDLELSTGLEVIAGLLYVPLSSGGKDFIAFLRKGQPRDVHWAGRPHKPGASAQSVLEPRKSFKIWSEVVAGRCRTWTDEQMETASVLALVYGKFIEVWRQKETALQTTKLTNILLSNASHEVRTPLNHIINYLEMALDGPLDLETRDNLSMSHAASKSLLFTINDLLDLTRLESGNETSLNEAFDLQTAIEEATRVYSNEAGRRELEFKLDIADSPRMVVGDAKKIKTVVANLTANALKYTTRGSITVRCNTFGEPEGLRAPKQMAVEILVADSGCGIPSDKLESIFREFEQVESSQPKTGQAAGLGLGLAVVARIVEQLGGQLRVDSKVDKGSQFSFLIPLTLSEASLEVSKSPNTNSRPLSTSSNINIRSRRNSGGSGGSEIDSLVEALSSNHMNDRSSARSGSPRFASGVQSLEQSRPASTKSSLGAVEMANSGTPLRPVKIDTFEMDGAIKRKRSRTSPVASPPELSPSKLSKLEILPSTSPPKIESPDPEHHKLRVLIVEDNDINRRILGKRLTNCGHTVVNTTNGQEGLDKVKEDRNFDCVLMDLQMPILNGYEATEQIRKHEKENPIPSRPHIYHRQSYDLNGRIPIFAVSASLLEHQRDDLRDLGMDGWILKPIDFKRLDFILKGVTDSSQRKLDVYHPGYTWEIGGWFDEPSPDITTSGT